MKERGWNSNCFRENQLKKPRFSPVAWSRDMRQFCECYYYPQVSWSVPDPRDWPQPIRGQYSQLWPMGGRGDTGLCVLGFRQLSSPNLIPCSLRGYFETNYDADFPWAWYGGSMIMVDALEKANFWILDSRLFSESHEWGPECHLNGSTCQAL